MAIGWTRMAALRVLGTKVASVNPLTSQYGNNVRCYPGFTNKFEGYLELSGKELRRISARFNDGRYVDVPGTVGFCMYIRGWVLLDVGYFDDKHFLVTYEEETD